MSTMSFGIKAPVQFTGVHAMRRFWHTVDGGGFDTCWVLDHLAPMGRDRTGDIFEAWTVLAAMAEATQRIRVGTLVTGNGYRHPALLAKMAATVDQFSGGRLEMGLGAGGDEYADGMLGIPVLAPRERIDRLGEACHVLRALWQEPVASFAGQHYQLSGATSEPKPVQRPGPPLWLGSSGERFGLRVVAEHADVWMNAQFLRSASADPEGADLVELNRLGRVLDRHAHDLGRDPTTIRRAVQFRLPSDPDDALRTAERYVDAGYREVIFMVYDYGDAAVEIAEAAVALLPRLRALG